MNKRQEKKLDKKTKEVLSGYDIPKMQKEIDELKKENEYLKDEIIELRRDRDEHGRMLAKVSSNVLRCVRLIGGVQKKYRGHIANLYIGNIAIGLCVVVLLIALLF